MSVRTPTPPHKDESAAVPAKDVVIVVFDGVEVLDVAGPASVFHKAGLLRPGTYRVLFASPHGGTVETNAGTSLADTLALSTVTAPADTVIVAGGDEPALRAAIVEHGVSAWLAAQAPRVRRLTSVCTGAFALGAAGLLDGRAATTHWNVCELLQATWPQVDVQHDRIYVRDGAVWTSAGVTTGIELALALVEDDLGHAVAMEIARTLAMPLLRGAGQSQLSAALQAQQQASHRLRELIAWIGTHLQEDLRVETLAARVQMSARHFAREFAAQAGSTPARFVEHSRVAAAAQLLAETRWTHDKVATESGFGSVDALQRAFARAHGVTLSAYRQSLAR